MMLQIARLVPIVAMAASAVVIPRPSGPYDVFYHTAKLVDNTRADPFDPQHRHRAVMTSIFVPTHCPTNLEKTEYLSPATAAYYSDLFSTYGLPSGSFNSLQLQTCPTPPRAHQLHFPVVLFSPALGTTRLFYTALAQSIASAGYIVVSIDHPYDTEFLEFPDGTVITGIDLTDEQIPLDLDTRARDVTFVLDQLSSGTGLAALLPGTRPATGLKVHQIGIYGHSLGGAAAAEAMRQDHRIIVGANLDGTIFGPVLQQGIQGRHRPFLLFGHENKTQATDPSWAEFWSSMRGWKLELELDHAQHYAFSDLPSLLKLLGLSVESMPAVGSMVGMLDGARALEIVWRSVVAFMDFGLRGTSVDALQGTLSRYPEVSVVGRAVVENPVPFGDWPNDAGFEASVEHREPVELPVTGSIPAHLDGTLYRVGPGTYKANGSGYQLSHWFDGFTYLHRFQLVAQPTGTCKVFYNSRGQVDALIEQARKSGTMKYMTFGQKRDPCESIFRKIKAVFQRPFDNNNPGLINAGVTVHANIPAVPDRMKVSNSSPPFRSLTSLTDANILKHIDPETLEPMGVTRQKSLHPDRKGPLSCAHAVFDAASGDLYNYNLDFGRFATYRIFRVSAATGQTEIIATITGPEVKPAYLHSFFLSENYLILCIWPAIFGAGGAKILWERNLADALRFDPTVQARWYVVDRKHGNGVVATYLSPAFFSFHTINAWERKSDDGTTDIVCDIIQYPTDEMIQRGYYEAMVSTGKDVAKYFGSEASRPKLVRYRLHGVPLPGKSRDSSSPLEAEPLLTIDNDCIGDLPTINPNFNTRETRYVYNLANRGKSSFFDAIAKIDLKTQEYQLWAQERHTPGEAIFVPNETDEAEDAGYLLSVVLDGDTGTSYLLCLNARDMTEVGRAVCDAAIGFGFHGSHYRAHI